MTWQKRAERVWKNRHTRGVKRRETKPAAGETKRRKTETDLRECRTIGRRPVVNGYGAHNWDERPAAR